MNEAVLEQLALLPRLLTAHLQLTLAALVIGVVISVPTGIGVTRVPGLERPVLALASIILTIPGLALLAIMVPILGWLSITSIGYLPALIALSLYSLLPVLSNTVTGIGGVDPAVKEAARGVGMTSWQSLRLVVLPLAMPVLLTGVRTSAVWLVGMTTLSTPIGAPSLGDYIFTGLQTRNYDAILVGCVSAACLALLLDGLLRALEHGVRMRKRLLTYGASAAFSVLLLYAMGSFVAQRTSDASEVIKIGAKSFTEQYVVGEILRQHVEAESDTPVQVVQSLGSSVVFDAVRAGDIDVSIEYTGTIWAHILGRRYDRTQSRESIHQAVGRALRAKFDIAVVTTLGFENAYALAMRRSHANALGIESISDLSEVSQSLSVAGDYEIFGRSEWRNIEQVYGITFAKKTIMDPALMYQAIAEENVDVITAYSTDGRLQALGLKVLVDDRGAIPPYDAIVIASGHLLRSRPDVIEALEGLGGTLDGAKMRRLNAAVDREGQSPRMVARRFLSSLRSQGSRRF